MQEDTNVIDTMIGADHDHVTDIGYDEPDGLNMLQVSNGI